MAQPPRTREPDEPTHDPSDPGYHDPGDAVPEGIPGPGSEVGDDARGIEARPDRDPGDAVPEGVAPAEPPPLTEKDRQVKRQLEELPKRHC
ncbi:hypothetical protein [Paracraurococcus lichenis]|uniref:Uncharacterized protein n=1 Tax=Paracraurococcus lichenis TaxID=3064888 RepID=A0ABT9DVV3_9PROT|nr:hypothetical protein [Paracraurococcus sp. LOR1-02]MDO9708003.1 hypothetical protein [Paracraurococcus sp. LOR1-02]